MGYSYNHTDPKGYYAELGINPDAAAHLIKQSYREQAKIWHPDYNDSEEALEKFQKISVAYEIIQDDRTRLIYDLLSEVYNSHNFPDMFSLKVFKNHKGSEDLNIRTLVMRKKGKEIKEVCNFKEAKALVLKNFLLNFWKLGDVVYNFKNLGNFGKEDFNLLAHNAVAYEGEGKFPEAYASAAQALEYANPYQQQLLKDFMSSLKISPRVRKVSWNYGVLKLTYISIPLALFSALVMAVVYSMLPKVWVEKPQDGGKINYYQEVHFRTGGETVDDVVVSKILSIPVDIEDLSMLYHLDDDTNVVYGPSKEFDVLKRLEKGHTIRVTGFSPDKLWYRVMLDNGDMGFVPAKSLKKGIGSPIPKTSKIFQIK